MISIPSSTELEVLEAIDEHRYELERLYSRGTTQVLELPAKLILDANCFRLCNNLLDGT